MDKMVMYNASAVHSELGPRGDQIGLAGAATVDHQAMLASDVVFRVGVGAPDDAGTYACVVEMNGWRLWKWLVEDLGEIPLEYCGDSEEAVAVRQQFDDRKESLIDRVQQAVFTLVKTKTTGKGTSKKRQKTGLKIVYFF